MTPSAQEPAWPQQGRDAAKTASTAAWWTGELTPPRRGRRLASAASPPVVVDRWIANVGSDGALVVRDHRTGRRLWDADVELATAIEYGEEVPTPAVAGEVVCSRSGDDEELRGFDLGTGTLRWSTYTGASMLSSPTVADGMVLIGDESGRCHAIKAATGSRRWVARLGDEPIERAPAVAAGTAFVGSRDGMVHAVDLATGTVRWPAVTGYVSTSVAVSGDTLLTGSGERLLGIDAGTGERCWRRRLSASLRGTLAVGHGTVVACGETTTVHAVAIADGRLRWERALDGEVASPSIAGDVVFVASQEPALLHALSLDDGHELWNLPLPGPTLGAPIVVPGTVLLTAGGSIDVLRFDERQSAVIGRAGGS
jgi:outer membrane protein assembly factor BamB